MKTVRDVSVLLVMLLSAACVKKPVTAPRAVVPETATAELRIAATPGKTFGNMVALGIGMSSGETATYSVSASRIFACRR